MSPPGDADVLVQARSALLDALEALQDHREAIVLIGAQAVYLHTDRADVALAEYTKDSDLGLDTRLLRAEPLLEEAMARAEFKPDPASPHPGRWVSKDGIPVDLMVPDALSAPGGRRGARIPPHSKHAARRAVGLEAVVVDNLPMDIHALDPEDRRVHRVRVASPSALLVAKLHKLADREDDQGRLEDKDAHDVYRLLVAIRTEDLRVGIAALLESDLAEEVTRTALVHLQELFAAGATAPGSSMAGRAEEGLGDPLTVSAQAAVLAADLLNALAS